jgi:hypothetical protein
MEWGIGKMLQAWLEWGLGKIGKGATLKSSLGSSNGASSKHTPNIGILV